MKKAASGTSAGQAGILRMVRSSLSFTISKEKEFNLLKKSCFSLCTVPRIRIVVIMILRPVGSYPPIMDMLRLARLKRLSPI